MSHELDEKVARALGWVPIRGVPGTTGAKCRAWTKAWSSNDNRMLMEVLSAYSTDYACVPEMLAWLRSRFTLTDIGVYRDGEVWARGSFEDVDTIDVVSSGDTIPEALSRLVVAVAEAKEAGQ